MEETFRRAWEKNGTLVYTICGLIILGVIAKGGWEYLVARKEVEVRRDYAACSTAEAYRAFAASHPGHRLAALAELNVADDAYSSGHFSDAVADYEKAAADLPAGPFKARARLGQAMSLALSGKSADAETDLRQILNDTSLLDAYRCEAGYQLAALAAAGNRPAEVDKLSEQLMQIDATNPFVERTQELRAEMPASPAPVSGPSIALPGKP
jgi:hypothetical protein